MCDEESSRLELVTVAHSDSEQAKAWEAMERRFPVNPNDSHGPGSVLRTGTSEFVPNIEATNSEHLEYLRQFNLKSVLTVPLIARGKAIGVISFASSSRSYAEEDLALAEELARRAALAVDNARLYSHSLQDIENLRTERVLRENFVATLSHDLRSPLSAAKTSAQMIVRYSERHERHPELANRIVSAITRADRMITDLLDANRIRAGEKLPLQLEKCNFAAIARDTVEELATIHGDHFALATAPVVEAYSSCEGFRRILENLATNAVKYGDLHFPVRIALEQKRATIVLSVTNQGEPIRAEDQARLFEPFTRTTAAQKSGKRGWGIGLTLCRGIAETLGGSIGVESSIENGTTFSVELPNLTSLRRESYLQG